MNTLLLEIRSEEIPAGYIEPALNALSANILKKLTDARIEHGSAKIMGTPRRLAVEISNVADKQTALTTDVIGPPEKVGMDDQGKPTVAAEKFAEKVGVPLSEVKIKATEKGRYLYAVKTESGNDAIDVLKTILPDAIKATPFPKTMKWADMHLFFARPIQSILAMFGTQVIPFQLENIVSSNQTCGHRFMHNKTLTLSDPSEYTEALRKAHVMVDFEERKQAVISEISNAISNTGGKILPDDELVHIVKNLVEYPFAVVGKFDEAYLEVPDEVLINAMREHQKYFAVINNKGKLMPCFIAVNNTRAKDMALVATGHERVLRARLADARFFYKSDIESPLESWVEKLHGVLFQVKLGSMYEKIERVQKIAGYLAEQIGGDQGLKDRATRAARLCKADLVSQVVGEFPKLQGIMGRIYASVKGEDAEVATAIEEHYRPTYSGGKLPETVTGSIIAIADKIDSICGCFSVGLAPSGASDPYALRRQAIGILQIAANQGFSFSLKQLIETSCSMFVEKQTQPTQETVNAVLTFFQSRLSHLMTEEGFSKDVISAVTAINIDKIPNVWDRVRALEQLKSAPDFAPLSIAFKRVVNIIRQAGDAVKSIAVNPSLFEQDCESALYKAYTNVKAKVENHLVQGAFDKALIEISTLRSSVDAFFDGVMVMTDDVRLKTNRLALLKQLSDLFAEFADFSKIST